MRKGIECNMSHINVGINYNQCINLKKIGNNISGRKAKNKI